MLEIQNLTISQNHSELLSLNISIAAGEFLTVMGKSGSGKSTLLSWVIGQLDKNFSATGRLLLNAKDITDVPTENRHIGLMFQDPLLFPHLTVLENIGFGLNGTKKEKSNTVKQLLSQVGLSGLEQRMPSTLSGGQQSRVALLRLMANKPSAVLLDEPFSKLDDENRKATRDFVIEQLSSQAVPVILVTHDKSDASAVAGKTVHI